jgi:hypothetical protein
LAVKAMGGLTSIFAATDAVGAGAGRLATVGCELVRTGCGVVLNGLGLALTAGESELIGAQGPRSTVMNFGAGLAGTETICGLAGAGAGWTR